MPFTLAIEHVTTYVAYALYAALAYGVLAGFLNLRQARNLPFFLMRRRAVLSGWRSIGFGLAFGVLGGLLQGFGTTALFRLIPPTASVTPTAAPTLTGTITPTFTVTWTPSVTVSPTESTTPTETATPAPSPTPSLPRDISSLFTSSQTPEPGAAISPVIVAPRLNGLNLPVNASDTFTNPVQKLFGQFSYNFMADGVQWTALWLLDGKVVWHETKPWDGDTGGNGYTGPVEGPVDGVWAPGEYEIQIFVGQEWKSSGRFTVVGTPPTATPTSSPIPTKTPTPTPTPTRTRTRIPSATPTPAPPTRTPRPIP